MTEDTEDNRPSVALHNDLVEGFLAELKVWALDWDFVVKARKPTLDYMKASEKADILLPIEIHMADGDEEGTIKSPYLMFAVAEDGEEEEIFRSERYALVDVIADAYVDEYAEKYALLAALEDALAEARQAFTATFGIGCTAEAVAAKEAEDRAAWEAARGR